MAGKNAKPLNGNDFEQSTTKRTDNQPSRPLGTAGRSKTQEIRAAEVRLGKAVHGLVFNLLPDPSNPYQWTDSMLVAALLKDDIFEDVLKKYAESVANGTIAVSTKGQVSGSVGLETAPQKLREAGLSVLKERVVNLPQVQKVKKAATELKSLYVSEVTSVFHKNDWSQICVVVATGIIGAGIVAGFVDVVNKTKNDKVAGAVSTLVNWTPTTIYEVGDLQATKWKVKVEKSDIEWKPSQGTWKASLFASGEWQVRKDLTLKGRMEVSGSQKGVGGNASVGATFLLGYKYLESVSIDGIMRPAGNYEIVGKLNKKVVVGEQSRFDLFVGVKYQGRYQGAPDREKGAGLAGIAGFELKLD
ncbi:MAG: hypothetical protein NTY19_12325 [Planctomycetota bacterium]|nr:hypothetical protein [Planctomycetota bacterium]